MPVLPAPPPLRGTGETVEHGGHLGPALLHQRRRGGEVAVLALRFASPAEDHHLNARRQGGELADEAGLDGDEERSERGLGRPPGRARAVVQRAAEQDVDPVAPGL